MKEIQSPELLKPRCDKEGDRGGGGTHQTEKWMALAPCAPSALQ